MEKSIIGLLRDVAPEVGGFVLVLLLMFLVFVWAIVKIGWPALKGQMQRNTDAIKGLGADHKETTKDQLTSLKEITASHSHIVETLAQTFHNELKGERSTCDKRHAKTVEVLDKLNGSIQTGTADTKHKIERLGDMVSSLKSE